MVGSDVASASSVGKTEPPGPQAEQIAAPSTIAGKIRKWEKRMANLG
ncbi:MAG: hypothetical protein JNM74_26370 [Myxococcales bacterium]|nr:hypothetical protein [Myxococcales bacterium]